MTVSEASEVLGPEVVVGETRYGFRLHQLVDGRYGIDLVSHDPHERTWWGNWAVVSDRTALTPEWLRARLHAMIETRGIL